MLRWRIALGIVLITILVGLLWADHACAFPGIITLVITLGLGIAATHELINLIAVREPLSIRWPIYFGVLATIVGSVPLVFAPSWIASSTAGWLWLGFVVGAVLACLALITFSYSPGRHAVLFGLAVFCMVYIGVPLNFLVQLRLVHGPKTGLIALVSMIVVVKMSDVGAYVVGRLCGRHRMAPKISPGKTWEGALGAIIVACLVSWVMLSALSLGSNHLGYLLYGASLACVGILGDLAESVLKRDAQQKDSSHWMPGFGGVLDILDSLLIAAPVAYAFWSASWVR